MKIRQWSPRGGRTAAQGLILSESSRRKRRARSGSWSPGRLVSLKAAGKQPRSQAPGRGWEVGPGGKAGAGGSVGIRRALIGWGSCMPLEDCQCLLRRPRVAAPKLWPCPGALKWTWPRRPGTASAGGVGVCRGGRRGWGRPRRRGLLNQRGWWKCPAPRQLGAQGEILFAPTAGDLAAHDKPWWEIELGEPGRIPWSSRNRNQRRRHLAPGTWVSPRRPTSGVTEKLRARSGREAASRLPHPDDPGRGGHSRVRRRQGLLRSWLCGSSRRPGARRSLCLTPGWLPSFLRPFNSARAACKTVAWKWGGKASSQ